MEPSSITKGGESPPDYKNIAFLASFPKSGSTWVRMLISAYINQGYLDINTLVGTYGDSDGYFLQAVSPKNQYDLSFMERLMLRPAMLMHMQAVSLFDPVVVKTHSINGMIEGVAATPHHLAKCAVVIARDPRDVAVSYADHMGSSIDDAIDAIGDSHTALRDDTCKDIKTIIGSWSSHLDSWMGENPFPVSVITYERMKEDPGWALGVVLDKIGWPAEPKRVQLAVKACEFSRLRKQEEEHGFSEKSGKSERFFRSGKAGGWGDVLTDAQAKKIEKDHEHWMAQLGYLPA